MKKRVGITADENKREAYFNRKYWGLHKWKIRESGLGLIQAQWLENNLIREGYERIPESEDFNCGGYIVFTFEGGLS